LAAIAHSHYDVLKILPCIFREKGGDGHLDQEGFGGHLLVEPVDYQFRFLPNPMHRVVTGALVSIG